MLGFLLAAILGGSWAFIVYALVPQWFPPDVVLLLCFAGLGLGLVYLLWWLAWR